MQTVTLLTLKTDPDTWCENGRVWLTESNNRLFLQFFSGESFRKDYNHINIVIFHSTSNVEVRMWKDLPNGQEPRIVGIVLPSPIIPCDFVKVNFVSFDECVLAIHPG